MTYQLFYILPTSGALIAMRLRRIHQALLTILGLLLVAPQGLFAAGIDLPPKQQNAMWKVALASSDGNGYVDGKTMRQWQVKFRVDPVAGKYMRFQAEGIRSNPPKEGEQWRPSSLQYLLQVDGNFIYEVHDFAYGVFRWQRLGPGAATIDPQRLNALRELLGTFRGDYANAGSEAYGIAPADVTITSSAQLSATGSLITQSWTSVPKGNTPEKAFEAHVV